MSDGEDSEPTDLHDMFASYFEAIQVSPRTARVRKLDPERIKVKRRA